MPQAFLPRLFRRLFAKKLPSTGEMEAYGAAGEETIYRKLRESFDCVIRNVIIPHGEGYLEKDFLVVQNGIPLVVEVKNWKGMISASLTGDRFFQEKADGTRKDLNSPVRTTARFLTAMKGFYGLSERPLGMVVFADPECDIDLPPESEGIALVTGSQMISAVRSMIKNAPSPAEPFDSARALHCTRLYAGDNRSFCKGMVTDAEIPCFTLSGEAAALNPLYLRYISVDHGLSRDKLTVTFVNDASAIFYNYTSSLTLHCLDGSILRVALSRLDTVVF
ncbi:MAG: NERD domain-containing protein [Ruminococcaceae bacterium]|nr:NERD domain-containing protein [Oscillospiraceae bacterium]